MATERSETPAQKRGRQLVEKRISDEQEFEKFQSEMLCKRQEPVFEEALARFKKSLNPASRRALDFQRSKMDPPAFFDYIRPVLSFHTAEASTTPKTDPNRLHSIPVIFDSFNF